MTSESSDTTSVVINDAIRFLQTFYLPISEYPLHCYSSTAFMPQCQLYDNLVSQAPMAMAKHVELLSARQAGWGQDVRIFEGHNAECTSVAFLTDSRYCVSGSVDGTVRVWRLESGATEHILEGHDKGVTSVAVCPTGKLLASGSWDGRILVRETITFEVLYTLQHPESVLSVDFPLQGMLLASGSEDSVVRLWDEEDGFRTFSALDGHTGGVSCVAFSPDASLLASASNDCSLRIWNVAMRQTMHHFEGNPMASVKTVAWSPLGEYVVSGSFDGTVRLWNMSTLEQAHVYRGHATGLNSVTRAPSLDKMHIAFESPDGSVWIIDAFTGALISSFDVDMGDVRALSYSRDGEYLAAASNNRRVYVWSVGSLDQNPSTHVSNSQGHNQEITSLAISRDGLLACTGSADKTARLWSLEDGRMIYACEGHTGAITYAHFSECGTMLATGSEDGNVFIWNVTSHTLERRLPHQDRITCCRFSPAGDCIAVGTNNGHISTWNVVTSTLRLAIELEEEEPWIYSLAYSPLGRILASVAGTTAWIWDANTGESLQALDHEETATTIAFSNEGARIAVGCLDGTVYVWESHTGALLTVYEASRDLPAVIHVEFGEDNSYVLVRYADGKLDFRDDVSLAQSSVSSQTRVHAFQYESSGWLIYSPLGGQQRRLCWVPPRQRWAAWRGRVISVGTRVIIGANSGVVTILECGPLVSFYDDLEKAGVNATA